MNAEERPAKSGAHDGKIPDGGVPGGGGIGAGRKPGDSGSILFGRIARPVHADPERNSQVMVRRHCCSAGRAPPDGSRRGGHNSIGNWNIVTVNPLDTARSSRSRQCHPFLQAHFTGR